MADEVADDISGLQDRLSAELFPASEKSDTVEETVTETEVPAEHSTAEATAPIPAAPTEKTPPLSGAEVDATVQAAHVVPKSWPKEMHEHWGKIDPKVQEYWEKREHQMLEGLSQYKGDAEMGKSFKEVVGPYIPHMRAAGVQPEQMVGNLLNAQWKLTQGPVESRKAAYEQLGKDLGFGTADANATPMPPEVLALQRQVEALQSGLTAREQAALGEAKTRAAQEVEAFASDAKSHPYFDEVADDIVRFIQQGFDLNTAYTKAVRANDVTWQKEVARIQTETEAKWKENARLDSLPKKKAAGVNVKSRDSANAPTELLGTMDDTLKATFRSIKERVH